MTKTHHVVTNNFIPLYIHVTEEIILKKYLCQFSTLFLTNYLLDRKNMFQ